MAGLGSLYELIKAGGLSVARAAARAGASIANVSAQLGSSFLAAAASAINALAAPAFREAQEQAFADTRTPIAATGYPAASGSAPLQFGPHQYAYDATFPDARTGQTRTVRGYYSSESELTAAELANSIYEELEMLVESPNVAGGNAALPDQSLVQLTLRGYYQGA